jgi:hypothetical protein
MPQVELLSDIPVEQKERLNDVQKLTLVAIIAGGKHVMDKRAEAEREDRWLKRILFVSDIEACMTNKVREEFPEIENLSKATLFDIEEAITVYSQNASSYIPVRMVELVVSDMLVALIMAVGKPQLVDSIVNDEDRIKKLQWSAFKAIHRGYPLE